jgi:hypothetical protein
MSSCMRNKTLQVSGPAQNICLMMHTAKVLSATARFCNMRNHYAFWLFSVLPDGLVTPL